MSFIKSMHKDDNEPIQIKLETLRNHRWIVTGEKFEDRFVVLKSVRFYGDQCIGFTYYMVQDLLKHIISRKYPNKLAVEFLKGNGKRCLKIEFDGIEFERHVIEDMVLDYSKTEISTLEAILKYNSYKITVVR